MRSFKSIIKHWLQRKFMTAGGIFSDHLAFRFSYAIRAEHLNNCALNSVDSGVSDNKYCNNEFIVSLTTYDRRLYEVYLAIESIMQQTMKPNKIVLWLSDDLKNVNLPSLLRNQQKRGLEIRFCKDIRSYKKLIPSLKTYPDAAIITIDDDVLYNFDLIESFIRSHMENPGVVYSAKMHRIKLLKNGNLEKYKKWKEKYESFDLSPLNFPTGIGGILYPPNCFNSEIFNEDVYMNICKFNDDIWFKAMSLYNGTMSGKIFTHSKSGEDHLSNDKAQVISLSHINIDKNMNDVQLKAVFDKYDLYGKLRR